MDLVLAGLLHECLEICHRAGVFHSHFFGKVLHGWYETCPDDVLDVDVVAKEVFLVIVDVDDSHQPVTVLSEVIEERTVLTELVCVCRIVCRRIVVAEKQQESTAKLLPE